MRVRSIFMKLYGEKQSKLKYGCVTNVETDKEI